MFNHHGVRAALRIVSITSMLRHIIGIPTLKLHVPLYNKYPYTITMPATDAYLVSIEANPCFSCIKQDVGNVIAAIENDKINNQLDNNGIPLTALNPIAVRTNIIKYGSLFKI